MVEDKSKTPKLKDFLSLVQNKKNRQFSFVIKKRMFREFDLTPTNILNMRIPIKFDKQKLIKPNKQIKPIKQIIPIKSSKLHS